MGSVPSMPDIPPSPPARPCPSCRDLPFGAKRHGWCDECHMTRVSPRPPFRFFRKSPPPSTRPNMADDGSHPNSGDNLPPRDPDTHERPRRPPPSTRPNQADDGGTNKHIPLPPDWHKREGQGFKSRPLQWIRKTILGWFQSLGKWQCRNCYREFRWTDSRSQQTHLVLCHEYYQGSSPCQVCHGTGEIESVYGGQARQCACQVTMD